MILLLISVAGCAGKHGCLPHPPVPGIDQVHVVDGVPAFQQETDQCGPAALAAMLSWSGVDITPQELSETVFDPETRGTLQVSLVAAARRHGRVAYGIQGMKELKASLESGYPVLVLINKGLSWWPIHHYAVVFGHDPGNRRFLMAGGKACTEYVHVRRFRRMWSREAHWGLLVLPPGEVPGIADKDRWLKAVHGLERADRYEEAHAAYRATLERWPEELAAMVGRANVLYAMGDLERAEAVLIKAASAHPGSGPVFNNLANVLLELGKLDQALAAALKAIETGGPHMAVYTETLESICRATDSDKSCLRTLE